MKQAVIVVGSHNVGKSKTINKYFKRLVGISASQRKFAVGKTLGMALSQSLEEKGGYILSQSLEEKGNSDVKSFVNRYKWYQKLVCAARPNSETPSLFSVLKTELEKAGYYVSTVEIFSGNEDIYYDNKSKEILTGLT